MNRDISLKCPFKEPIWSRPIRNDCTGLQTIDDLANLIGKDLSICQLFRKAIGSNGNKCILWIGFQRTACPHIAQPYVRNDFYASSSIEISDR